MKIPKRVNAALDWMGHNVRIVAAVGAALIISISMWWLPLLSAFVLGIAVGGITVHQRMASRQAVLRTDIDDLLRQNGALRREKLSLASGVIAKQTQLTAKLPVIPDDPAEAGADDQPRRGRTATTPSEVPVQTNPLRQPDSTAQTDPSAKGEKGEKGESRANRTTKLPVIPDDPGND